MKFTNRYTRTLVNSGLLEATRCDPFLSKQGTAIARRRSRQFMIRTGTTRYEHYLKNKCLSCYLTFQNTSTLSIGVARTLEKTGRRVRLLRNPTKALSGSEKMKMALVSPPPPPSAFLRQAGRPRVVRQSALSGQQRWEGGRREGNICQLCARKGRSSQKSLS